jgi:osmotically-inducible protein OsmY
MTKLRVLNEALWNSSEDFYVDEKQIKKIPNKEQIKYTSQEAHKNLQDQMRSYFKKGQDTMKFEIGNRKKISNRLQAVQLLAGFGLLMACVTNPTLVMAETSTEAVKNEKAATHAEADNSGKNIRDRNDYRKTADDQALAGRDIEFLAQIRSKLTANDNLSVNAKNVKIIIDANTVTLRGPVKSAEEKELIEQISLAVTPGYKIISELEVTPG